jgi:2-(1,2-epoxy-1,2-dihydrophenyl)acetyl-CoA isomerase
MEYTCLHFTNKNGIANIVMDNQKTLNALDMAMSEQLTHAFTTCEKDDSVKVIVLSGAGRAFCGGGDISFFVEEVKKPDFKISPLVTLLTKLTIQLKQCPKPVIAAVHSAAAGGGCNLALACDMVIAANNAKFLQAFVNIGLVPDTGGAFLLPRMIGTSRAFEMFATGRPVLADEALALGLVSEVCAPEELESKAAALAAKLAAGPGIVYGIIKKMLYASMYQGFDNFALIESELQDKAAASEDFVEGITAFMGKRKAAFKGK